MELIRLAKDIGADYVKFQCYLPQSLTIDSDTEYFIVKDKNSPWLGMKLWDIYQKSFTPRDWFPLLFDECRRVGIEIIVTPYNSDDLDFLESIKCPRYKISAFEAMDMVFVKEVANTKKQVFLSAGHLTFEEISIINIFLKSLNKESLLMHSISKYPPELDECNFPRLKNLKLICDNIGFSDHSIDEWSTFMAISYGATIIEKHLKNCEDCLDAHFSLSPWNFETLIKISKTYYHSINSTKKDDPTYARSIFCVKDIKQGEVFTTENIAVIRPNNGIHPINYFKILNRKSPRDILRGHPIIQDDLQDQKS